MRTEEQKRADANLTEAIEAVLIAYGLTSTGEIMMEYVVLAAQQRFLSDDEVEDSYSFLSRDNAVGRTRAVGLMQSALMDQRGRRADDDGEV